jgi:hypothetical protein
VIERGAERTGCAALAVARQATAYRFGVGAVLDGDAESDCRIASVGVGRTVAFGAVEKQFADGIVGKSTDRAGVTLSRALELERFGGPSICKPPTLAL